MPLLLVDLDNTLVDRDAAFRDAVAAFLAEHNLPTADITWATTVDNSGYAPRDVIAAAMADRYRGTVPSTAIRTLLDTGPANRVVLLHATETTLRDAPRPWLDDRHRHQRPDSQQGTKLRRIGLDKLVAGAVVFQALGHKKPSPEIFRAGSPPRRPSPGRRLDTSQPGTI